MARGPVISTSKWQQWRPPEGMRIEASTAVDPFTKLCDTTEADEASKKVYVFAAG